MGVFVKQSILGYTAGIVDGEGSLVCWIECNAYRERVTVHMKYECIPQWMLEHWGGSVHERGDKSFAWVLTGEKMRDMLRKILPYMVEKKRQANVILELAEWKKQNILFQADTPLLKNQKHKLYLELKALHH